MIYLASFFRSDASAWIQGRKDWKQRLLAFTTKNPIQDNKRIWFHVASLGEFEQGRVLLEMIRKKHPSHQIILSFFSPSGFVKQKDYPMADYVCYFPSDRYAEIKDFINLLQPNLVIFIKYDFWFNCLSILNERKIPYCFVSMIMRKNHYLFNPFCKSLLNQLKLSQQLFLQNEETQKLLLKHEFLNTQITGDTRWDRVVQIADSNKIIPGIEQYCTTEKIWIAGSIWPVDLEMIADGIAESLDTGWKIILVPHKIEEAQILDIENKYRNHTIRYSQISKLKEETILIMDQIGYLATLYRYAKFAYIGGGFGKGIHNILEAVIYKIPVCFGPNYQKFQEAQECSQNGMAFALKDPKDFKLFVQQLNSKVIFNLADAGGFINFKLGSSKRIYNYLEENKLI